MTLYTREENDLQEIWYPEMIVKIEALVGITIDMEFTERC